MNCYRVSPRKPGNEFTESPFKGKCERNESKDTQHLGHLLKDYGIELQNIFSTSYPVSDIKPLNDITHAFIPISFGRSTGAGCEEGFLFSFKNCYPAAVV